MWRWELVKVFGCPIDSEILKDINPAQMIWYAMMINRDKENVFDAKLNMTEYLASFINNEGVRQTRDAREKQKVMPDADFDQMLRDKFGRDLTPEKIATGVRADVEDIKPTQPKKKVGLSIDDIKRYMGDDIKFHSYKK